MAAKCLGVWSSVLKSDHSQIPVYDGILVIATHDPTTKKFEGSHISSGKPLDNGTSDETATNPPIEFFRTDGPHTYHYTGAITAVCGRHVICNGRYTRSTAGMTVAETDDGDWTAEKPIT